MKVDLSSDFFQLFNLPIDFQLSESHLVTRFRVLQANLHPDKFASSPDAERRWSMQAASYVNEGYQTLHNELRRASYLLQLNGISLDDETDTQMSPMFLMEQMELREKLESATAHADPESVLDSVSRELKSKISDQSAQFAALAQKQDWQAAREAARQWQFLDKLRREVKVVEEQMDDY